METYMAGTNGPLQSAMLLDRENRLVGRKSLK